MIFTLNKGISFFKNWNYTLLQFNGLKKGDVENSQLEFEEKAKTDPYFNKILTNVKELVKTSRELSIDEIGSITDDFILVYERKLNSLASSFFFVGISFTILGLFFALNTISLTEANALRSTEEMLSGLIRNFQLAFISTIIGVISSTITKVCQYFVSKSREPFKFNLLLYIKNVIIPIHAVPEVEKDLGELVRTLSNSSSSLIHTSEQLSELIRNSQLSTESIVESVETFSDVTEKMGVREENLISALSNLSKYLTDLRGSLKEIVAPIDALRHDLIDRDQDISLQVDFVKRIYDKQIQIDSNLTNILDETKISVNKMSEFFNEKFTSSFNETMKNLSKEQKGMLDEVIHNTKTTRRIVESMPDPLVINREMRALGEIYNQIKIKLENDLLTLNNSFKSLYHKTTGIDSDVNRGTKEISNRVEEIKQLLDNNSEFRISIENDFKVIADKLEQKNMDPSNVTNSLKTIEMDINKIIKMFDETNSLREETLDLKKKAGKGSLFSVDIKIPKIFNRERKS